MLQGFDFDVGECLVRCFQMAIRSSLSHKIKDSLLPQYMRPLNSLKNEKCEAIRPHTSSVAPRAIPPSIGVGYREGQEVSEPSSTGLG